MINAVRGRALGGIDIRSAPRGGVGWGGVGWWRVKRGRFNQADPLRGRIRADTEGQSWSSRRVGD